MIDDTPSPNDATRYWDYLLAADQDPRTLLFVVMPVALAVMIGVAVFVARRFRKRQEDRWLLTDLESDKEIEK